MASAPSPLDQAQTELETILNGPADTPPPGVIPRFENPPNLEYLTHFILVICIVLTSLAVSIRMYTRQVLLRSLGYDDYTSAISWLGNIIYVVPNLLGVKAEAGVHMWNLRLKNVFRVLYWAKITTIIYNPIVFTIKLSILLQYSRIYNSTGRANFSMWVTIQIHIWSILIFYLIAMFFDIFQCNPRAMIWNKLETTGHCYNNDAANKASGFFNVISDFAILILPMPSVWRLQMSRRKKVFTTGVFAIGLFACLTSILRTYCIWRIVESSDKSYLLFAFGQWSEAEILTGIIVGCFPVMPKLFQHVGLKPRQVSSLRLKSANQSNRNMRVSNDLDAQVHGQYYTLSELQESPPRGKILKGARITSEPIDLV